MMPISTNTGRQVKQKTKTINRFCAKIKVVSFPFIVFVKLRKKNFFYFFIKY